MAKHKPTNALENMIAKVQIINRKAMTKLNYLS